MPTNYSKVTEYPGIQGSRERRIYHVQFAGASFSGPSAVVVCDGVNVSACHLTYSACLTAASLVEVGAIKSLCVGKQFRVLVGCIVGREERWVEQLLDVWDQGYT